MEGTPQENAAQEAESFLSRALREQQCTATVFEERALPFQLPFMREGTFCLVIQKKSFKELMLDRNLISGGVGEDVFMADIIQA